MIYIGIIGKYTINRMADKRYRITNRSTHERFILSDLSETNYFYLLDSAYC